MNHQGRILVVDDLPTNRLKLSLGLRQQGHTVQEAEDGRQALQLLRTQPFDLVLLDIVMPEMDGYEVLTCMKEDRVLRHVPVIVISAQDELGSVVRGIELGAEDYLPKAFHPVLLKARIDASLEKKYLRDKERERIDRDLSLAREIQMGALPREVPTLAGYEIAAWSRPAEKTGGDIYDLIVLDSGRVALLMADASGHGVGPALSAARMQSMFRMGLLLGFDVEKVMSRINGQLKEDLPPNQFITAFGAILDGREHSIHYHSWGQAPLLHFDAARDRVHSLAASALPMGILSPVPVLPPVCRQLAPGDLFAVISDGFFEYQNRDGEPFGAERIDAWLRTLGPGNVGQSAITSLVETIQDFAAGAPQEDDMTAILIRRTPLRSAGRQ
jgi:serine phosphatase RsbU (regulator of sigma subunit)